LRGAVRTHPHHLQGIASKQNDCFWGGKQKNTACIENFLIYWLAKETTKMAKIPVLLKIGEIQTDQLTMV